jgi:glycerol-3-phosphate dehydrogenase
LIECGYYEPTDYPDDTGTIRNSVYDSLAMAKSLVPTISNDDIISTFTGVRVFNTRNVGDHIVEPSKANPRFVNVVIRLPGIIGALPMARYVVELLGKAGLELVRNGAFNPFRKTPPKVRHLGLDEMSELIQRDSRYGNVICLCETVTEGEVAEAVDRGAVTVEGIKFRTRATMGRCQGNFCRVCIEKILEERGIGSAPREIVDGDSV